MFDELIGQESVKRELKFFAMAKKKTGHIPPLLMVAEKGSGKTHFAKEFRNAVDPSTPMLELNCAGLGKPKDFFELVFPSILEQDKIVVLFDECHNLPNKLMELFLTAFAPVAGGSKSKVTFDSVDYNFNFCKQTYLFATTEPNKLSEPFIDRMEQIHFADYTTDELREIFMGVCSDITFDKEVYENLTMFFRGNPRSAVKMGNLVQKFSATHETNNVDKKVWEKLVQTFNLRQFGLTDSEVKVLRLLHERGPSTLQTISATTGYTRSAIQRGIEVHLMRMGLMSIDGKRKLTEAGQNLIVEIK